MVPFEGTVPEKGLSFATASGAIPSSCSGTIPPPRGLALRETARPVLTGPFPGVTEQNALKLVPGCPPGGENESEHAGAEYGAHVNRMTCRFPRPPVLHSS